MSGTAQVLEPRIDQFGKRSRRRRALGGRAAVFVPEEALMEPHLPPAAGPEAVRWRASALAALHALQAHGYTVLLQSMAGGLTGPGGRSASFNRSLMQRMAQEADVHPRGILPPSAAETLPALLREAAAAHGLDMRQAWFLSWDESLGTASRRTGCRSVRLLEPGRSSRRRWPLLRGHVPMKLVDAAAYILRCDGHLVAGQSLSDLASAGEDHEAGDDDLQDPGRNAVRGAVRA